MSEPAELDIVGYEQLFSGFDTPLAQQIRTQAYGKDIGQHSWVTAEELTEDVGRLQLVPASRLLDLGCGPGGPLTFVLGRVGCHGTGLDLSTPALAAARARAVALGVAALVTLREANLDAPLAFPDASFEAAMSIDAILHARDRASLLREVARVLTPGGRFLYTDAAVITGSISDEERSLRAVHGHIHFTVPGYNERVLEETGFRVEERQDRTASLLRNAMGRLAARLAHREALEQREGAAAFERQRRYLETVIELARRGAVARVMYLAQVKPRTVAQTPPTRD